jgi:hypothetical protein
VSGNVTPRAPPPHESKHIDLQTAGVFVRERCAAELTQRPIDIQRSKQSRTEYLSEPAIDTGQVLDRRFPFATK